MADDASRQYLTLTLGGEHFALESSAISEVLDMLPVTWVPLAPSHLRGVVNLRGNAATVVDARAKLELPDTARPSCLIIVERDADGEPVTMAALADAVHEVVEIAPTDILPPPDMGLPVPPQFVKGLARIDGDFVMLLDADRLFSLKELAARQRP